MLVMDVDGTLTDGKIYYGNDGELFKAFDALTGHPALWQQVAEQIFLMARNTRAGDLYALWCEHPPIAGAGASGAVCAGAGDRKQHDAEGRFLMDAALSHWLGRWPWRVGWGWWYLLFCKEAMPWIRKLLCWRWCWRWWGCWLCCGRWFPGIGCKGI